MNLCKRILTHIKGMKFKDHGFDSNDIIVLVIYFLIGSLIIASLFFIAKHAH